MATQEAKAVRRATALNELDRLSALLAEAFKIDLPDLRPTHRDADLQRIQRIEAINELLAKVLESAGVKATVEPALEVTEEVKEPEEPVKNGKPPKKSAKVKGGSKKRSLKR